MSQENGYGECAHVDRFAPARSETGDPWRIQRGGHSLVGAGDWQVASPLGAVRWAVVADGGVDGRRPAV